MRAFKALSIAILKGFMRDRAVVFFAVLFPLMFLVLFGAIFNQSTVSKTDMVEIGSVPLIDGLSGEGAAAFAQAFKITHTDDREAAIEKVRKGDADVAIEQQGDSIVATYTQTDQVKAATVAGVLRSFVEAANIAATGQPPKYTLDIRRVEDKSLAVIDFMTPGLLGWAIAMSAAFGAAATLQGWRQSKLLRRLQLAPTPIGVVVAARVVVAIVIAFVQTAIFVGAGTLVFGMHITGAWPMIVPLVMCGALCFMAVGLLAGAIAKTSEGAVNLANMIVLPMAFLSGSFFPLDDAPKWLRVVSGVLPLHHLNEGILDVTVRGQGPLAALAPMGILLAFAAVVTLLAARLFRWESI